MSWCSGLEAICRERESLAPYTWYRLGGPARWLVTPPDEAALVAVLRRCRASDVPHRVLGLGANLLVRDEGVDAAVIRLAGPAWERVALDGEVVVAGAGVDFTKLVRRTIDSGLAGFENLAGIPGTVGGVVRMNAGGKHGSLAPLVQEVRLVRSDGAVELRSAADMGFEYRRCAIGDAVVAGATFRLRHDDQGALIERFRRIWLEKHASQPPVSARTCGCIFKNPPGHSAGALIDRAGLKGRRLGAAEVSPQHANFIVAHDGATARDVLELARLVQREVGAHAGVELNFEVEIW